MKIRSALTLKYTAVTAVVFLLCMVFAYLISDYMRSRTFFHDLKSEAITKAHLFLEKKVDSQTMQSIYINNRQFINEVEVAVYTPQFKMLYHDAIHNDIVHENRAMIDAIMHKGAIDFYINKFQAVGMVYRFNGQDYIVTAAAYDGYGYENLYALRRALCLMFIVGLILLWISGYFLARLSLQPIRSLVSTAEKISVLHIDERLPVKNANDELGELSLTFNELLNRLERSFKSQKMFVSNVSHELRTPLAALIAQLDLCLSRSRSPLKYQEAIRNALEDAKRMNKLVEGLLHLAKADYQFDHIKIEPLRLDELLLDVRESLLKGHPDYVIQLMFGQGCEDESLITVNGNRYLLSIAFSNLIDNNCKYSDNKSSFINISSWQKSCVIRLSDQGVGIDASDLPHVFELFYRGKSQGKASGHGIGMALTQKIIQLHGGMISVDSAVHEGTSYKVELPHV